MCLAIPMQVVALDGFMARCVAKGVERDVSLLMLQDASVVPGDYLIVHLGHAVQKVSAADARTSWELFDQILAAADDRA